MNAPESTEANEALKSGLHVKPAGMSYKFQRLRERVRQAILTGEFAGKLPGERVLAQRFRVNAKTLGKALTDLAAEGLLDRSIGRGTFVKGTAPAAPVARRWLVLCDAEIEDGSAHSAADGGSSRVKTEFDQDRLLLEALREAAASPPAAEQELTPRHLLTGPLADMPVRRVDNARAPSDAAAELHVVRGVQRMRPSFLNQFDAVIDMGDATPDNFLRDLVVRNVPLVVLGRESRTYSMHAVLVDRALGAARLGREMLLGGHTQLLVVEARQSAAVFGAVRQAAVAFAGTSVERCEASEVSALLHAHLNGGATLGITAIICDGVASAHTARTALDRLNFAVPRTVSLAAVGCAGQSTPCSGYFVEARQLADAAAELLRAKPTRPATLWLAGTFRDGGTLREGVADNLSRAADGSRDRLDQGNMFAG